MHIYHRIPRNMTGEVLYPLSELQKIDPALYNVHAAKYEGREHLMEERIPLLENCLWNEVIFLAAVHPAHFRRAFESVGFEYPRPFRAFEFDVAYLDHSRMAVIMTMEMNRPRTYEPFDPTRFKEYEVIPQKTLDYWKQERNAHKRPFHWMHVPHILYRGSLDVSSIPRVEA